MIDLIHNPFPKINGKLKIIIGIYICFKCLYRNWKYDFESVKDIRLKKYPEIARNIGTPLLSIWRTAKLPRPLGTLKSATLHV